ncbi:DHH family phosphoesterase [Psychromonas sp. SP041]|uniref:single-stranded-DNA-specific exonuclease RecJ n=1 Tax=Psychromonas sp. SP041 TaxID=1365007 RepID=UPI0010C781CA|nr:DHH family phosphoesterase [Psychromonas sp. SP041]
MKIKPFHQRKKMSQNRIHNNEILNSIYQNRGIKEPSELIYDMRKLINPFELKGMKDAAQLISNHIVAGSKILIIGDYDCDGATSTSIGVEGLTMLGSNNVDFLVPDREKHGYGLSNAIVEIAAKSRPDLIITVDNGIAAFEGAHAVRNLPFPCQLLITDHHLPAESNEVPLADAIVNPSQPGCNFPSKSIAGCGVIFYTIIAARAAMRQSSTFEKMGIAEPKLERLLDLVALGTVADVVKLDYNNRLLVNAGLKIINEGRGRPGINAILQIAKKEIGKITSQDFGFAVGPRINAAGRLDDMSIGIQCLMAKEDNTALALAERLDSLNVARKEIENGMLDDALDFIDHIEVDANGISLYDPSWHEGVVGILASRVKERLGRPTICFTDTGSFKEAKNDLKNAEGLGVPASNLIDMKDAIGKLDIKGSARSIPGIHLKHILDEINKKRPDVLSKFGGHAMAAGLSVKSDKYSEFKDIFDQLISRDMTDEMKLGAVIVDVEDIDPRWMTLELAELIESQPVWGQGFEYPVFSQKFNVISKRPVGDGSHLSMVLQPVGSDIEIKAIAFSCIDRGVMPIENYVEASFKLSVNEFRGRKSLQIMIEHLQDPQLAASMKMIEEKEKSENLSFQEVSGVSKNQKQSSSDSKSNKETLSELNSEISELNF